MGYPRALFCLFAVFLLVNARIGVAADEAPATVNGEVVEVLEWDHLMPADFTLEGIIDVEEFSALDDLDPRAAELMDQLQIALQSAPVVPEMDGKMAKVPGFVVPIEGEGRVIYKFFLVPYFGACIHTPPPPSNQIIYVEYEPGVTLESIYDAVWVTGKLKTETFSHELASSGYGMEAFRIEPYEY